MADDETLNALKQGKESWESFVSDEASDFRADLSGADLANAQLAGYNLRRADLRRADLSRADLRSADLSLAQLDGARLDGAQLGGANMRRASLAGSRVSDAQVQEADLIRTDLRRADLSRSDLTNADLRGADMFGCDLTLTKLCGANLRWAYLLQAELMGTDFAQALVEHAKFTYSNDIGTSNLTDVEFSSETEWPGDFDPRDRGAIEVKFNPREQPPGQDEGEDDSEDRPPDDPRSVGPGVRIETFDDPERLADALGAVEELLGYFRAALFDGDLDDMDAARLQAQIDILLASTRDPAGPDPVIAERAIAHGLRIVTPHLDVENPAAEKILDRATDLGDEDPVDDGRKIGEILDEALRSTPAPANEAELPAPSTEADEVVIHSPDETGEESTFSKVASRAMKGALDGIEEGAEDLFKRVIGSYLPAAIAASLSGSILYFAAGGKSGMTAALLTFLASIWKKSLD